MTTDTLAHTAYTPLGQASVHDSTSMHVVKTHTRLQVTRIRRSLRAGSVVRRAALLPLLPSRPSAASSFLIVRQIVTARILLT